MLHTLIQIYVHAFFPLCLLTLCAAISWGSTTERTVACSFVIASATQNVLLALFGQNYAHLEPSVAIVDTALLCVLFRTSLRHPQWWLLTACALQLLSALAHLGHLADLGMSPLAYAILTGTGGYPTQLLLIAGIANYRSREHTVGGLAADHP